MIKVVNFRSIFSEANREQISKLLESIEERLGTLENETKELKEYQRWDRDRRALEYTIYDRELKETRKKLAELQSRREQSSESTAEIRKAAKDCAAQIEVNPKNCYLCQHLFVFINRFLMVLIFF